MTPNPTPPWLRSSWSPLTWRMPFALDLGFEGTKAKPCVAIDCGRLTTLQIHSPRLHTTPIGTQQAALNLNVDLGSNNEDRSNSRKHLTHNIPNWTLLN